MEKIVFVLFFCANGYSQTVIDIRNLVKTANDSLVVWYTNGSVDNRENSQIIDLEYVNDFFELKELKTYTVPYFEINTCFTKFRKGNSITELIDFKNKNNNQIVVIYTRNNKCVTSISIYDKSPYQIKETINMSCDFNNNIISTGMGIFLDKLKLDISYLRFRTFIGDFIVKNEKAYFINFKGKSHNYDLIEANYYLNNVLGPRKVNKLINYYNSLEENNVKKKRKIKKTSNTNFFKIIK